ncbi:MAG: hypothetical protein ACRERC_25970 [Candidatus Binatia bacterium]
MAVVCLALASAGAGPVMGQVTIDRGASIIVFPKVVADASADTALQLVNLAASRASAFCSYIDGRGTWQSVGFTVALATDQPLAWTAAGGRSPSGVDDPNDIPPAPADFRGLMLCVQVDGAGSPLTGNQLSGEATLASLTDGDVASYSAIGLRGSGLNDGDDVLCIGGQTSDQCIIGAEYDPCPAAWEISHPADGAEDGQLGTGSSLHSRLVITPCTQNLASDTPEAVRLNLQVVNELEQSFSTTATVTCWSDQALADIDAIFTADLLGTAYARTTVRPVDGDGGVFVLLETRRQASPATAPTAAVAAVPHQMGFAARADLITLPIGRP